LQQHYFKNLSIFVYDNDKTTLSRRYDVGEAILQENKWFLHHVNLYENGKQTEYEELPLSTSYSQEKIQESNAAPETLSFWQIPSFIQLLDKSGLSSLQYRLHFQNHMAKILLMMAMVLIATGFCLKPARFGKTSALMTLGLSFGFFFYFMNDIIYALGLGQRIPIFLSVWAPSFLGILIGGFILIRIEEESK
jgi:lipopolysaccharide export system permease protein